jgi:hypothetical protein
MQTREGIIRLVVNRDPHPALTETPKMVSVPDNPPDWPLRENTKNQGGNMLRSRYASGVAVLVTFLLSTAVGVIYANVDGTGSESAPRSSPVPADAGYSVSPGNPPGYSATATATSVGRGSMFTWVRDIGAVRITSPTGAILPGPVIPAADVHNWGNERETCKVFFRNQLKPGLPGQRGAA